MTKRKVHEPILIQADEYDGYLYEDILSYLGGSTSSKGLRFKTWINGETLGELNGREIVYSWDWERFCKHAETTDE